MSTLERRLAALEGRSKPAPKPRAKVPTPLQFIESCSIEDAASGRLVAFKLWPAQRKMLCLRRVGR